MVLIERNQAVALFAAVFAALMGSMVPVMVALKRRKREGR